MKLTARQGLMLQHLDEVVYRQKKSGLRGFFFRKEDCTETVNSLITKGLITTSGSRSRLERTELAQSVR